MHLHPNFINLIIGFGIGVILFSISYWVLKYRQGKGDKNADNS